MSADCCRMAHVVDSFAEEDLSAVVGAAAVDFCLEAGGSLDLATNSMATISAASPTRRLVRMILV